MNAIQRHIITIAVILTGFAIGATLLVALIESLTRDKILDNERQAMLDAIHAVLPKNQYNNDILTDTLTLPAKSEVVPGQEEHLIYRARLDGKPVAAIFNTIAPNGYSGRIKLLIAVYADGRIAGTRVISHKETPGLGDKIEIKKSDWIAQFTGLSLSNPKSDRWSVKKDGGVFDQFTGATVTPRAVVQAIKTTLDYFQQQRTLLFSVNS